MKSHTDMNTLREAAQKVIDERYKPDGEWDDLKNAISDLADVLDRKPIHSPSNNGGPAFPHWNCAENTAGGMSLRDWFAGMVMAKIFEEAHYYLRKSCEDRIQNGEIGWSETDDFVDADFISHKIDCVAYAAYRYADAMIEVRKEDA